MLIVFSKTWSKFTWFDFWKNLYALFYRIEVLVDTHDGNNHIPVFQKIIPDISLALRVLT
jgi:nucleoside-specific outer membrane channel protein Tsx